MMSNSVYIPALGVLLLAVTMNSEPMWDGFTCTGEGHWPDPQDCRYYHVCTRFPHANPEFLDTLVAKCEDDLAYDPLTGMCLYSLDDPVCTRGSIACLWPGQWGTLEENPSIYWVCDANRHPVYYDCGPGKVYDGAECAAAPTTPAPPPAPRPPVDGVCKDPGAWPDLADCRYYYSCSYKLKFCHSRCCYGYHFDPDLAKCVKGRRCN